MLRKPTPAELASNRARHARHVREALERRAKLERGEPLDGRALAAPEPPLRPPVELPQRKLLCVTGTPCGGTSYTAQRLYAAGYDVHHEHMGADGMVCGWGVWHFRRPYPMSHYAFDHIWRVIRHPLRVMETLPIFSSRFANVLDDPPRDPVECALRWWVETHERLEGVPTIRLERLDADLPGLLAELPAREARAVQAPIRRSKRRRWPQDGRDAWSWADLEALAPEWAARARALTEALL